MRNKTTILVVIVIAQFFCTSLWFAGNAVIKDIVLEFNLAPDALAHLTSAVQFGFITGTLCFAFLTIADRFSPSVVFCISAVAGSITNLAIIAGNQSFTGLLSLRFTTGIFLAGIYPVGMKIAADYFDTQLGKVLGFLVGALVLGTAFPHLLRSLSGSLPWRFVLIFTSVLATLGGVVMLLAVPDGPYRRKSKKIDPTALFKGFANSKFRSSAFGYFGHMWELYTFWAFVPIILGAYQKIHAIQLNIPVLSFIIIASGSIACIMSGYLSLRLTPKRVATLALFISAMCCLLSPFAFYIRSTFLFLLFLFIWGMAVIADSPLFSTLVANNAPSESKGTALTIVNCIGFSITIISLQFINLLMTIIDTTNVFIFLVIGPVLGLWALKYKPKISGDEVPGSE